MSVAIDGIISTLDIASLDIDEMSGEKVYPGLGTVFSLAIVLLVSAACGSGSPTSPTQSGYAGQWSDALPQGGSIAFTVSSDQKVTAITINYTLNGCAVARTLSGLSLPITPPQVTPGGLLPSFEYGSTAILIQPPNTITAQGIFTPGGTAAGGVGFFDYMGCGSGGFQFSARRR